MLAIIIDPLKRKALFEGSIAGNEYDNWRKFFAFKHLDKTIHNYENKVADIEKDSFMNLWRRDYYSNFSSYVHNDFLSFLCYGVALPQENNQELKLNMWGHYWKYECATLVYRITIYAVANR